MPLSRISATLPAALVRSADRLARKLGRSRSWVLAEALRRYVSERAEAGATPVAVREPAVRPYGPASGLGEQRLAQLEADSRLTPEQRVHAAEETIELALRLHHPPRVAQLLAFESYEDYLDWKRREVLW